MPRDYRSFSTEEILSILDHVHRGTDPAEIIKQFDVGPSTIKTFLTRFGKSTEAQIEEKVRTWNKYKKIFRAVFDEKYEAADRQPVELPFTTEDISRWQSKLGLEGGNPYDLKYNAKGRGALAGEIQRTAPAGKEWRITPTGKGKYVFRLYDKGAGVFELDPAAPVFKIPDNVPSIVERYSRDDEQALLARIRYNGLVTTFLGMSTYSLQSHWKTTLKLTGSPTEIDEMYVGLNADGQHFMIPVEAKSRERSERLTADQIYNNYITAKTQFPNVIVIPLAAKVIDDYQFAMVRFAVDSATEEVTKVMEKRYVLSVNPPIAGRQRPVLTDREVKQQNEGSDPALDDSAETKED